MIENSGTANSNTQKQHSVCSQPGAWSQCCSVLLMEVNDEEQHSCSHSNLMVFLVL